ncbi:TPA: DEAD/DEAH box helicase family protein [Clostridioides difficile]|nr:DEAD/DEAH box helicase family protein [Clostridioides difficile]HBF3756693.1 DEAD/DEAH box helicase family protein [Clostridioides difficile]HBF6247030.1 DEAD/DEAH box helicase family protein [Clostridioides difficile]HBY3218599.1 DEAD/DEAH box helicase family protein [Clostridioides difficile]
MKLQFDAHLEYQEQAISSIVDIFKGQEQSQLDFTISYSSGQCGIFDSKNGVGNSLEISNKEILENIRNIQLRNGIAQIKELISMDFDIEMETGTGKTYVYLRTILELYIKYGFLKFIVVVPNIAIKESVYKSLQITEEHFKKIYNNVIYDYFIYDSNKLEQVRNFAISDHVQIMVINIDAFRKSFTDPTKQNKANIIHRSNDKLNDIKPIDLIRETKPFVIIDEPQSVDTTPKAKEAIKSLNSTATFRYSATHVNKHNLVYKLDAIDSYNLGLVKQIEVAGFVSKESHNNAYIKFLSVNNKKTPIKAKLEIDKNIKGIVKRVTITIKKGDDLYEKSGGRDIYEGYIINEIFCEEGKEYINFTSKPEILKIGKPIGYVDDIVIKEQQIHKTIEEHLNKELLLNRYGIKVLSLFFIDHVANYRYYDENGIPQKGIYAKIFEKHYKELICLPKYKELFKDIDLDTIAQDVHDGYFSVDKKGILKDTNGTTNDDNNAYNLIMKDKERLLSFETKLKFIFSHSALREGWDNPNVFQICTLNETNSEVKKRQEIGRGLRLCVNQVGERQHGFNINTLTVIANESYEEFVSKLQKEYEEEEGIHFGMLEMHSFANILVQAKEDNYVYLGQEKSEQLYKYFEMKGYIDAKGNIKENLKKDIKNDEVSIPNEFDLCKMSIINLCKKISGNLNIKNNKNKKKIHLNKQVFISEEFEELWEHIKYKTTYNVDFNSDILIKKCCDELQKSLVVSSEKLVYTKARVDINGGGIESIETDRSTVLTTNGRKKLPDIISYLQNRTNLTRKTVVEILIKSNSLYLFKKNPQRYMEDVAQIIISIMRIMIVDGIKYTKLGDSEYYAQELFETKEVFGYLEHNMISSKKSVFDYVIYDSKDEKNFAKSFENNSSVKLYAKLPNWFKIPTPLGSYNPDWAVLVEENDEDRLYFVLESKKNILSEELRPRESAKIHCGYKHFEAIDKNVTFKKIDDFNMFIENAYNS